MTPSEEQASNASPYDGIESIVVGNDNSLPIFSIGLGFLHANANVPITFNHLLHTPCAATNLLYVQNLCTNNNVFIEFHPSSFYVEDYSSMQEVFQGSNDNGLYKVTSAVQGFTHGFFVDSVIKEGSNDNQVNGSMACVVSNDNGIQAYHL